MHHGGTADTEIIFLFPHLRALRATVVSMLYRYSKDRYGPGVVQPLRAGRRPPPHVPRQDARRAVRRARAAARLPDRDQLRAGILATRAAEDRRHANLSRA